MQVLWESIIRFFKELFSEEVVTTITEVVVDRAVSLLLESQRAIEAA